MSTVEELKKAIAEEMEEHKQRLEDKCNQRAALKVFLGDLKLQMQELITCVTNLRVAKSMKTEEAKAGERQEIFDTGLSAVDDVLYAIQENLKTMLSSDGNLLSKLSSAARRAVVVGQGGKPSTFSTCSSSTRTTNVALTTRDEVRGTRRWSKKHYKKCLSCATKSAKQNPWERVEKNVYGVGAAPDIRNIPGKKYRSVALRFTRESVGEQLLELVRVRVVLSVMGENNQSLENPQQCATLMADILTKWVNKELTYAMEAAAEAPWNDKNNGNLQVGAAVDVLLHSLRACVSVSVGTPKGMEVPVSDGRTLITLNISITTPLHLSTLQPFVDLLTVPSQRSYILKEIVEPVAKRVGELFGMKDMTKYLTVAFNTVDALARIAEYGKSVPLPKVGTSKSKSARPPRNVNLAEEVRSIILALAVFDSVLEVCAAVPVTESVSSLTDAKEVTLKITKSVIQRLLPPKGGIFPPTNDPNAMDIVAKLMRAPTRFLEILNNTFSSNKLLPSTSRISFLDNFVSPKLKINYALNNFSELLIEFFRPYVPGMGVLTSEEKSKMSKSRIPPCTPVVEVPSDVLRANAQLVEDAQALLQHLEQIKTPELSPDAAEVAERGVELAYAALQQINENKERSGFRNELEKLPLKVEETVRVRVDIYIPIGTRNDSLMMSGSELVYFQVDAVRGY
ncbi:hypothetical protein TRVL_07418 [Trypanosoma vivax]|nr:hypothetical protein TRVL_07418 [Trypanosoma vivax]